MKGHLLMSRKERCRKTVFDGVLSGTLMLRAASEALGLSYRQSRRSYKRFREEGDAGLVHRSRGRPSNRGKDKGLKERVVGRYRDRYEEYGLGPTLAAEKLAAEGLGVDHETLRRWLVAAGLWHKRRKRSKHRERRARKCHFGEMVQMDGSHHRWFGEGAPESCLLEMVDDATGHAEGFLAPAETTVGALTLLRQWVERHGIPRALYTDRKNVYVTDREPTLEEQLAGQEPLTPFGLACRKLGIEIITAHSPQAKGRVERKHAVFQDRLVKELALRRITTIDTANALLSNGFIAEINAKFARKPLDPEDYHRALPAGLDLGAVFCFEQTRTVQNDWTIRYENRHYQIDAQNRPLPKPQEKVLVRVQLDNSMQFIYRDVELAFRPISPSELCKKRARSESVPGLPNESTEHRGKSHKPAADHPWRKAALPKATHRYTF